MAIRGKLQHRLIIMSFSIYRPYSLDNIGFRLLYVNTTCTLFSINLLYISWQHCVWVSCIHVLISLVLLCEIYTWYEPCPLSFWPILTYTDTHSSISPSIRGTRKLYTYDRRRHKLDCFWSTEFSEKDCHVYWSYFRLHPYVIFSKRFSGGNLWSSDCWM